MSTRPSLCVRLVNARLLHVEKGFLFYFRAKCEQIFNAMERRVFL